MGALDEDAQKPFGYASFGYFDPTGRVRLEASLQRFHPRAELGQFVLKDVHIGLDCRWGVLPVLWHEGQWPAGVNGLRQRFHPISMR
jgi:hypothetical protein